MSERDDMQPESGEMLQEDGTRLDVAEVLDAIWDRDNHCLRGVRVS